MLQQHGFQSADLVATSLVMTFRSDSDEYVCFTTCRLETTRGKVFESRSSTLG